jgi:hypothetical protein
VAYSYGDWNEHKLHHDTKWIRYQKSGLAEFVEVDGVEEAVFFFINLLGCFSVTDTSGLLTFGGYPVLLARCPLFLGPPASNIAPHVSALGNLERSWHYCLTTIQI